MGTIQANFFISLDGVVEAPETWHMSYFNDEMGAIIGAGLEINKAFLMGRNNYDGGVEYWPNDTSEFADYFNDIQKFVISSSLENPTWNNTTVVAGDVESVQRMKDSVDGQIFLTGSAITVRWLLENGLLDELQLLLHPVVVGKGQKLFEGELATHGLELVESKTLSTGVVHLRYHPAAA
jgi:dihydrofolate reductase